MRSLLAVAVVLVAANLPSAAAEKMSPAIQRIAPANSHGTASSVRVPDAPLVFTGQVFSTDLVADAAAQAGHALDEVAARLALAGSDLTRVARLTAYVADDAAVTAVDAAVAGRFAAAPIAFTLVRTPLGQPGARLAFEAVAVSSRKAESVELLKESVAILPPGGKIFISGQAEKGTEVASAVRLTMAGLHRSLTHLGLKKSDVVQVKAFIKPFGDHAAAMREIVASFDGASPPPVVLIEWMSDLFAEIELVASARSLTAPAGENLTYSWLPWLTKSPRYCNVAFVTPGTPLIFVGAVDGGDGRDPRTQMKTIFERLGSVLFEAGSSYRNLAKATYYLNDATARALLGDIRGVYFDPTRPPAASALNVGSFGRSGRAAMLDIVAVPVK